MGLSLSDSKKKKTKATSKTGVAYTSRKETKKSNTKEHTSSKKQSKTIEKTEVDDEVIVVPPKKQVITEEHGEESEVPLVGPFQGGLVHKSLQNCVNATRRRSDESTLFELACSEVYLVDGVFIGSIYIKSSFVKRAGGSALM